MAAVAGGRAGPSVIMGSRQTHVRKGFIKHYLANRCGQESLVMAGMCLLSLKKHSNKLKKFILSLKQ